MTHKQHAMTLLRPWPQTGTFKLHLQELIANLKYIVEIPTAYEDETGFHFGKEPALRDIQWPPA
jgi:hypothetical protein